ncbi:hypothetical protein LEP1GSC090_2919 [Leptospira borgpetersenii serovar Javanica str. MK146]|nr:hypothetical protein LEP1GSC090_2919 [Leptospira borgpetersenii serovar Javanica str. MK146]
MPLSNLYRILLILAEIKGFLIFGYWRQKIVFIETLFSLITWMYENNTMMGYFQKLECWIFFKS